MRWLDSWLKASEVVAVVVAHGEGGDTKMIRLKKITRMGSVVIP